MNLKGINWNSVPDSKDKEIWDRSVQNFWLPEKIPLSNDRVSWNKLNEADKQTTMDVFAGLTRLDTVQATIGAPAMLGGNNPFEDAILTNFSFMESVHAKSYSSIFSTLATSSEIDNAFNRANNDYFLNSIIDILVNHYTNPGSESKRLAIQRASVFLESFVFYSGFFWPLYLSSQGKLTNTADLIRLILRDETIHGHYIGYCYQKELAKLTTTEVKKQKVYTEALMLQLYYLMESYITYLYPNDLVRDKVLTFSRYNANKALMNLGYQGFFNSNETNVDPVILAALSPASDENHDFFSGSGSSYVIGTVTETTDDDWTL